MGIYPSDAMLEDHANRFVVVLYYKANGIRATLTNSNEIFSILPTGRLTTNH
jgi:hypothetical protein